MSLVTLLLLTHVQATFPTHLTDGFEGRDLLLNRSVVAQGVEITETVGGNRHFLSLAVTFNSRIMTSVDSWSDAEGNPISSQSLVVTNKATVRTTAEVKDGQVTLTRYTTPTGSDETSMTVVTSALPKGTAAVLTQFDPLSLFNKAGIVGNSLPVSVINPETMSVENGTLVQKNGELPSLRVYDLQVGNSINEMMVSTDGKMVIDTNSDGFVYKPVVWTSAQTQIVRDAGYPLSKGQAAILEHSYERVQPPVQNSVRRGKP